MRSSRVVVVPLTLMGALLAGCTNLSGLGGTSDFQCKAPEGIPCQSVSGVHFNERAGTLPAQRAAAGRSADLGAPGRARTLAGGMPEGIRDALTAGDTSPAPMLGAIRSEPTVIRIWIAPWEDSDGDLNDESRVYLQIDAGRWLIEHNRERIRREFAPLAASAAQTRNPQMPTVPGAARPVQGGASARTSGTTAGAGVLGTGVPKQEGAQ
ncbi:TraV family lipoprotein [Ideonella sp. 4Y16]|uniref:TraV family lipoprotein n=1 Tax=Ideonella alba TaxID=2824118 RepID=UPI001B39B18A|nr:TraV family lipoprotein [Ideonella alba]MBQ0946403.1 TraV family lipoprotein [Ideonella alba]